MNICPSCGYDPNPVEEQKTEEELRRKRLYDVFMAHAQHGWWLSQAVHICEELKKRGISPKSIIDIGCGDGRFWPAVELVFPDASYVGIDRMEEHIAVNNERMPMQEWVLGDFRSYQTDNQFDLALIMGTFNPKMPDNVQEGILRRVKELSPRHVVCLFDKNQSGNYPDRWIEEAYKLDDTLTLPRELQSSHQDSVVLIYSLMDARAWRPNTT